MKYQLLLLLIVSVIISGCVGQEPTKNKFATNQTLSCDKLTNTAKDKCFSLIAQSTKDLTICNEIANETIKADCMIKTDYIKQLSSNQTKNVSCAELADAARDKCYSLLAAKTGDEKFCDKLSGQTSALKCRASVRLAKEPKTPVKCSNLEGLKKDKCYALLAEATKKIDLCDKVTNTVLKSSCITKINSTNVTIQVKSEVVNCNVLNNISAKDSCNYFLGLNARNSTICMRIENQTLEGKCIKRVATLQNDKSACQSIEKQVTKDSCYTSLAIKNEDLAFCSNVINNGRKTICQAAVKKDQKLCDALTVTRKSECIHAVAVITANENLCAQVIDDSIRKKCVNEVKQLPK